MFFFKALFNTYDLINLLLILSNSVNLSLNLKRNSKAAHNDVSGCARAQHKKSQALQQSTQDSWDSLNFHDFKINCNQSYKLIILYIILTYKNTNILYDSVCKLDRHKIVSICELLYQVPTI